MDWTLEVVIVPVSDIDRAVAFYRDKVGFELDHDTRNEHMHVVQLTPRGSGCSIVIGDLPSQNEMAPGSLKGLQLVVADAQAARQELLDRGVAVSEIMVFDERDGGTFFVAALQAAARHLMGGASLGAWQRTRRDDACLTWRVRQIPRNMP